MDNWNNIPPLKADDIEIRVQQIVKSSTGKVGAILLLYKDARVDMRVLDEVFGPNNWRRTHEVINGNLFCNIDIWDPEKKEWIRKQDVGVESNTEKEKGQASDAFKRAGFNVGIGRELYTAPFIYVELLKNEYFNDPRSGNIRCYSSTRFYVSHIAYNKRREISELIISDKNGNVRYDMNKRVQTPSQAPHSAEKGSGSINGYPKHSTPETGAQAQKTATAENGGSCPICGGPISQAEIDYSQRKFGRVACRNCQKSL